MRARCEVFGGKLGEIFRNEFYKSAHKLRKLSSRPDTVDLVRAAGSHPVDVLSWCSRGRRFTEVNEKWLAQSRNYKY